MTIPIAEQAKSRRIEISREDQSAIGSHEGHKMISGESAGEESQAQRGRQRQPVTTGS